MVKKLRTIKRNIILRRECIACTIQETGWNRKQAIRYIKDTKTHYGITYKKYLQWKMYQLALEEQECNPLLSKKIVCELLEIPFDGKEECYSIVTFSKRAIPGCLAIVRHRRKAPYEDLAEKEMIKLAEKAISNGAKCLLTEKQIKDYPCLVVSGHVIDYAEKIIRYLRKQKEIRTVEVTGSYGKTTVTAMIETMLMNKYKTFGHKGVNRNMLPHAMNRIQKITKDIEIFLQEAAEAPHFGVPGHISQMMSPDIGIITSIGTSHMEQMGGVDKILESCMTIQDGMEKDGILLLNGDDKILSTITAKQKIVYYGMKNETVDFRAVNVCQKGEQLLFEIEHNGECTPMVLECIGAHNAQNAAGAFAAGKLLGMTNEEIVQGLSKYRPAGMRQRILHNDNYNFYIDCYNASMETMCSSIDALCAMEIDKGGRRIAVLGDIKELGDETEVHHRIVGKHIVESSIDMLICLGEAAEYIAEEAQRREKLLVYIAKDHQEVIHLLKSEITPLDIVLFKASHAMELACIPEEMLGIELE